MLKDLAEDGLPIYAECGGLMYLGENLVIGERQFPMAGVFPITFGLFERPQGHGYTQIRVDQNNPFFPVGTDLKGHEFHYSTILAQPDALLARVSDANGAAVAETGSRRGRASGTFFHLIAEAS